MDLIKKEPEKDKAYVSAIVDLLVSMGLTQEEVFCSSIPGFGIGYAKNHMVQSQWHLR